MSWCEFWSYQIISNTAFHWQIFPSLIFNARCSFCLIFQCRFFQHRVSWCAIYCCRIKSNKSSHSRISSHRMELVGRIIFQYPIGNAVVRSAIILKSVLPVSNLLLLDYVIENGVINYPLSMTPRFISVSWFFLTSVAFTLNLLMSELPLLDKRKTYV